MMSVKSEITEEKKESSAFDLAVVLLQAVAIAIVIRIFSSSRSTSLPAP